jgi:hypothetical protein
VNDLTKYNEIKELMKTGDMLEWRSNSVLGKLIRWRAGWFTKVDKDKEYSHTSAILRMREWEDQERRRYHIEAGPKGFQPAILSREIENYDGNLWLYQLKKEYNPLRGDLGLELLGMMGIGYDFLGLAENIFSRIKPGSKWLFCSGAIYKAYKKILGISKQCTYYKKHGDLMPTPTDMPLLELFDDRIQIL